MLTPSTNSFTLHWESISPSSRWSWVIWHCLAWDFDHPNINANVKCCLFLGLNTALQQMYHIFWMYLMVLAEWNEQQIPLPVLVITSATLMIISQKRVNIFWRHQPPKWMSYYWYQDMLYSVKDMVILFFQNHPSLLEGCIACAPCCGDGTLQVPGIWGNVFVAGAGEFQSYNDSTVKSESGKTGLASLHWISYSPQFKDVDQPRCTMGNEH